MTLITTACVTHAELASDYSVESVYLQLQVQLSVLPQTCEHLLGMGPGGPTALSGLVLGVTSMCTGFALLYAPALCCYNSCRWCAG